MIVTKRYLVFVAALLSVSLLMGAGLTVRINPATAVVTAAQATAYDGEVDIGLVAYDASDATAAANCSKLNSAMAAMKYGGTFVFANSTTGPVLKPIVFPAKTFYFKGTLKTNDRIGGILRGTAPGGYIMGSDEFGGGGTRGGQKTRFVRTDGANGPVIRLHGTAFTLENIDFYGRPYASNDGTGTKSLAGIQVEGGSDAVGNRYRGMHTIIGCSACECTYGIQCLDGYYDDSDVFHTDENHADLSYVRDFFAFNVNSLFRDENTQAVGWNFNHIMLQNGQGTGAVTDAICFDLVKGGDIYATNVILNHPSVILISVQDADNTSEYAYGVGSVIVDGLYWDAFPYPTFNDTNCYCTLFKYAGYHYGDLNFPQKYNIRIRGAFSQHIPTYYNVTKLVDLGSPIEEGVVIALELYTDILNMPTTDFARSGAGPWYRWQTSYSARVPIASDAITIREQYMWVETEGAASTDNLATINGGGPGSILVLRAYDDTHTVVVKNGTGNIKLAGSDFTMDSINDILVLVYDGTNWNEMSRSNNGS